MVSFTPSTHFKLPQLPKELRNAIYVHLDTNDTKSLRVTCSAMAKDLPLHFDRVFISANSRNIQVFNSIANHETYRHQVTEIIWDDARLCSGPEREEDRRDFYNLGSDPDFAEGANGCPRWFKAGSNISDDPPCHPSCNTTASEHMGLQECWAYYRTLLEDQRQVLASDKDIESFKLGLQHFTRLKRVTVTPATHGRVGQQLYRTPMIRAFPHGFKYPLPQAWPHSSMTEGSHEVLPWVSEDGDRIYQQVYGIGCTAEKYRNKWRGYRLVTQALVDCENKVTEFVVGGNEVKTGLNCRIFDQRCVEYDNLITLLKQPNFELLSLDLFTGALEDEDWVSYKTGLLRDALAQAKTILHFRLRATTEIQDAFPQRLDPEDLEEYLFPLRTIFPIDDWRQLRYFGMSNMLVDIDDLIGLLADLPPSLQCVELSHLAFGSLDQGYDALLRAMRDTLDWRLRPMEKRPRVHMVASTRTQRPGRSGMFVEIDDAIYSYLYGSGNNPFEDDSDAISPGQGGVQRDAFNPKFAAPF